MSMRSLRAVRRGTTRRPATPLRVAGLIRILRMPLISMPLLVLTVVLLWGTPHFGWNYRCADPACRYVRSCDYHGLQGVNVYRPPNGERCSLIRFYKLDWPALRASTDLGEWPWEASTHPHSDQLTPPVSLD